MSFLSLENQIALFRLCQEPDRRRNVRFPLSEAKTWGGRRVGKLVTRAVPRETRAKSFQRREENPQQRFIAMISTGLDIGGRK